MIQNIKTGKNKFWLCIGLCLVILGIGLFVFAEADADVPCANADCSGVYVNGFCSKCDGYEAPSGGKGTNADPYLIGNAGNLYWFAEQVNAGNTTICCKLTADIKVNPGKISSGGYYSPEKNESPRAWTPIGDHNTETAVFSGVFNGDGHTVSGLYYISDMDNLKEREYVGLIGVLYSSEGQAATVLDVGVVNSFLGCIVQDGDATENYVGGIVGYVKAEGDAYIAGCYNTGSVMGLGGQLTYVGGIVGSAYVAGSDVKLLIVNCYNTGKVTSSVYTALDSIIVSGGVVGCGNCEYDGLKIRLCYNSGEIAADTSTGGIAFCGGVLGFKVGMGSLTCTDCFYEDFYDIEYGAFDHEDGERYGIGASVEDLYGDTAPERVTSDAGTGIYAVDKSTRTEISASDGKTYAIALKDGSLAYAMDELLRAYFHSLGGVAIGGMNVEYVLITYISDIDRNAEPYLWRQKLETDSAPSFSGEPVVLEGGVYSNGHIYKSSSTACFLCGAECQHRHWGTEAKCPDCGYEPECDHTNIAESNGICPTCGAYQCAVAKTDYYEISNAGQLYWFAELVNSGNTKINGKLTADIILNAGTFNEKGEYTPKADEAARTWKPINGYEGTFDGTKYDGSGKAVGNYKISGLYYSATVSFGGLFAKVNYDGTVKNVTLENCYVKGSSWVGGIAGLNYYGTISGCEVHGYISGELYIGGVVGGTDHAEVSGCVNFATVTGTEDDVGGIVGWCMYSTSKIINCINNGAVSGDDNVGGVAGYNEGTISGCSNNGTVTGAKNCVGGIAGRNESVVSKCTNTNTVRGVQLVGGIAGKNEGIKIENCRNSGEVIGSLTYVGGVAGSNTSMVQNCYNTGAVSGICVVGCVFGANSGKINNCYYLSGCAKDENNSLQNGIGAKSAGETTADVEGQTTVVTKDQLTSGEVTYLLNGKTSEGDVAWKQTLDGRSHPAFDGGTVYYLTGCTGDLIYANSKDAAHKYDKDGFCTEVDGEIHYQPCEGEGTAEKPYLIKNSGNLYWFEKIVDFGYDGVARNQSAYGKLIADIILNEGLLKEDGTLNDGTFNSWQSIGYDLDNPYLGVFDGGIYDKDGKLIGTYTISGLYCDCEYSGLFGYIGSSGTVKNVTIKNSYIKCYPITQGGGIAGQNDGTVENCHNDNTTVSGATEIGGIVGSNNGTVSGCTNSGKIVGTYSVGGVVGINYGNIKNCSNSGDVRGAAYVGGVIGKLDKGSVKNCKNSGDITATGNSPTSLGGIVGYIDLSEAQTVTITGCSNSGTVSGGTNVGGIVGAIKLSRGTLTVENCCNTSKITGNNCVGGVIGNANATGGKLNVKNCFNTGEVTAESNGASLVGNAETSNGGEMSIINCYYLSGTSGCGVNATGLTVCEVIEKSSSAFASGEVTYLLNGGRTEGTDEDPLIWYQTCGTGYPAFSGLTVYTKVKIGCKDVPDEYTNTKGETIDAEHTYGDEGFCTRCSEGYQPCEGEGTAEKPYLIKNAGNLYWFAAQVNSGKTRIHAKLTADIKINDNVIVNGKLNTNDDIVNAFRAWTPIGDTLSNSYKGTFDGTKYDESGKAIGNYKISGIYLSKNSDYSGLFGYVNGTVKNVTLENSYINGTQYVGGIAGYNSDGTISGCVVYGYISGEKNVGGISGYNSNGKISGCANFATVTGTNENIGGIAGTNEGTKANIENCWNVGSVVGSSGYAGGVVGLNDTKGKITNCYYLVGCAKDGNNTDQNGIGNSSMGQTTPDVEGQTTAVTKDQLTSGEVTWLLNGKTSEGDLIWKQTIDGKSYPSFEGDTVYSFKDCSDNEKYSNSVLEDGTHIFTESSNGFCSGCGNVFQPCEGSGTAEDPYKIKNAGNLYWFAARFKEDPFICGKLTADIKINDNVIVDGKLNTDADVVNAFRTWTPIGDISKGYYGTFDGTKYDESGKAIGNYKISGLYFSGEDDSYVGLFGYVDGGTVKNVTLENCYVNGYYSVGGIAGYNEQGTISGCVVSGYVSGVITVGGIVGENKNGMISGCSNTGTVTANSSYSGGIVGYNAGTVSNCMNSNTVSGGQYCGGIAGQNENSDNSVAKIENCLNIGNVDGSGGFAGGVVGSNGSGSIVTNCYYLTGCATNRNNIAQNGVGTGDLLGAMADVEGQTTAVTKDQLTSGEVTWLLNGKTSEGDPSWKQTLDGKSYPSFEGDTVYCGYEKCDETLRYSNTPLRETPHEYDENGFCTATSGEVHYQPAELKDGVYQIKNAGNLFWFAEFVNAGNKSANAVLVNDIEIEGRLWMTPIGTITNAYTGTFDGNDHTISDLNMSISDSYQGLFGVIDGGKVKDLTIQGTFKIHSTVTGIGGIAGYAKNGALIENVTVGIIILDFRSVDGTVTDNRVNHVGGVVGCLEKSTVNKAVYKGGISLRIGSGVGGIAGLACQSSTISNSTNMVGCTSDGYSAHVGGIAGSAQTGTHISYCLNLSGVRSGGDDCIGGIAGYANENVKIEYCGNIGKVESTYEKGGYVGGILGYVNNPYFTLLANCYNYGEIVSNSGDKCYAGAIVGWVNTRTTVNNTIFKNNYYLDDSYEQASSGKEIPDAYSMSENSFNKGEVAYKLNGDQSNIVWKQTLSDAYYPTFSGERVYYGYIDCEEDGLGKLYLNDANLYETKPDHTYENGICKVCNQYMPATWNENKSYYEIGNAGQLFWFASQVNNSGRTDISAVLTADIDLDGKRWTPIGLYSDDPAITANRKNTGYTGTFDGQYHVIKNLYVEMTLNYEAGLFSRVAGGAVLKNFGIINATVKQNLDGHETPAKGVRAGIVAGEIYRATVENVFTAGTLVLETKHDQFGGLAGECKESTLKNCYTTMGRLTDGRDGNTPTTVTNCYYCANSENEDSAGTFMTEEQFKSGELAYKLGNSVYKQTLGTDEYPNFTGKKVNYGYRVCTDKVALYTNESTQSSIIPHNYDNGFCKMCDCYEPCSQDRDGYYVIKNAGNLYWFAALVNGTLEDVEQNINAKATLDGDIVVNPGKFDLDGNYTAASEETVRSWTPIGKGRFGYTGTFDGKNHTISGLYYDDSETYVGLFGLVEAGAVIKNVGVIGGYFCSSVYSSVGGLVGYVSASHGSVTITNCFNTNTLSADIPQYNNGNIGGLIGNAFASSGTLTIEKCYNNGIIYIRSYSRFTAYTGGLVGCATMFANGEIKLSDCYNNGAISFYTEQSSVYAGGAIGWVALSAESATLSVVDCYSYGAISIKAMNSVIGGLVSFVNINTGTITLINCYYLNTTAASSIGTDKTDGGTLTDKSESKTEAQFRSGEVTWLLNGCRSEGTDEEPLVWYQTLGESGDATPNFTGKTVYKKTPTVCSTDSSLYFSNTEGDTFVGTHTFNENGFCCCGTYQSCEQDSDGYYLIKNAGNLYWFAQQVNSGKTNINARLTGNIKADKNVAWTPIGNSGKKYSGTFDGNYFTISGLKCEGNQYIGLFGYNSGTIQNVSVADSYFKANSSYVGGIVGYNEYGTVKNCSNAGTVSLTDSQTAYYCGGIVGFNEYGTISNCYNVGAVGNFPSHRKDAEMIYVGGIAGASIKGRKTNATISNCYNTGSVKGSYFVGGIVGANKNGAQTINCYYLTGCAVDEHRTSYKQTTQNGVGASGSGSTTGDRSGSTTKKSSDQFKSGEVAWLLNGSSSDGLWKQKIGDGGDATPNFTSDTVYRKQTTCDADSWNGEYTNEKPNFPHDIGDNGMCTVCGKAYQSAVWNDNLNAYEIHNVGQLFWFAEHVNAGNYNANGILMTDLDLSGYQWTPIAYLPMSDSATVGYCGIFNGNFHVISNITVVTPKSATANGIFGIITTGTVKNLGVDKLVFDNNGYDHRAGGIAGQLMSGGVIENCYVINSTIKASSRVVGGIVGMCKGAVKNCYTSSLTLAGSSNRFGGITGDYQGGIIINCYTDHSALGSTTGSVGTTDSLSRAGVSAEVFASGEITWLLNGSAASGVWKQTIGTDGRPSFNGLTVYVVVADCSPNATKEYTNEETAVPDHVYDENGMCKQVDGEIHYQPAKLKNGYYEISNLGQLLWFADKVNNSAENAINGKLKADIDATSEAFSGIGTDTLKYAGIFDGNGHTLKIDLKSTVQYAAPFRYVNGATIRNLIVTGSISTNSKFAASLIGLSDGNVTVEKCLSFVVITSTVEGDGTHGGLVANVSSGTMTIKYCGFLGEINGASTTSCGGFVGWSNATTKISNSYISATFGISTTNSSTFSRGNNISVNNCYYVNALGNVESGATQVTAADLLSGKLTYLLNGSTSEGNVVWRQRLDADDADRYPNFTGLIVCCDGNSYYNGQIASVTIVWTEMCFAYTKGTWDVKTMTWVGGGWVAEDDGGTVTVQNTGNLVVSLSFSAIIDDEDFKDFFSVGFIADVDMSDNSLTLSVLESATVTVSLTGGEVTENFEQKTIGRIVITLS